MNADRAGAVDPAAVLVISGELTELRRVRQWARTLLTDLDDILVDVLSVIDELTSNALRHGRAPYRISLRRTVNRLRVEVSDGSREKATRRTPDDHGGRGLLLVGAYSRGWGQEIRPDGKTVWAEVDLAPSPALTTCPHTLTGRG
ncbi:MAG: ATP-binding protein [Actinophytocola sp.]|uniref:ATP-binding protein n=1 Tax=Actinophytocola sp. TaxID=1872138 RepID=UPI00132BDC5D|nr:ATP-binding protein [Actinophytocola sp.]MPZ84546.1 ATP-binding protein [Actinophytocola sp.]